jgi:hypothetical protein
MTTPHGVSGPRPDRPPFVKPAALFPTAALSAALLPPTGGHADTADPAVATSDTAAIETMSTSRRRGNR